MTISKEGKGPIILIDLNLNLKYATLVKTTSTDHWTMEAEFMAVVSL